METLGKLTAGKEVAAWRNAGAANRVATARGKGLAPQIQGRASRDQRQLHFTSLIGGLVKALSDTVLSPRITWYSSLSDSNTHRGTRRTHRPVLNRSTSPRT